MAPFATPPLTRGRGFFMLGCRQQGVLAQVCITLGGFDLGVPQDVLHLVQRAPRVDQQAGKRVTQIVHAHIEC